MSDILEIQDSSLKEYIRREIDRLVDSNNCEHRPTMKSSVDRIKENAVSRYKKGKELTAEISEEDMRNCFNYYRMKDSYGGGDLVETKELGSWALLPRYFNVWKEYLRMKEFFLTNNANRNN